MRRVVYSPSFMFAEPGELFYTNVSDKHRIMAVYAGTSLGEGRRISRAGQSTGKISRREPVTNANRL